MPIEYTPRNRGDILCIFLHDVAQNDKSLIEFKEFFVSDPRVAKFAKVLVEHSTRIVPGDRVLIEATTAAEPLVRELYIQILEKGGQPHPMIGFPGMVPFIQDDIYLTYAKNTQLDFIPTFYKIAYDQFESRIRIHSATNTRATTNIDPAQGSTTREGDQQDH